MSTSKFQNILSNLSLIRLAGIKQFILVDIYKDSLGLKLLHRKEKFYKVQQGPINSNYKIIYETSRSINNDYNVLTESLQELLTANKIKKEIFLVVGINEFKFFTAMIPEDVEDTEIWFIENSNKFIPEGSTNNQFRFSYEKLKQDEQFSSYVVVVVRNDYIDKILDAVNIPKINLLAVYPFALAINKCNSSSDTNKLFFDIFNDRINYSFYSPTGYIVYGEYFLNGSHSTELPTDSMYNNVKVLKDDITKILEIVSGSVQRKNIEPLELLVNCDASCLSMLNDFQSSLVQCGLNNKVLDKNEVSVTKSLMGFNNITCDVDNIINFVGEQNFKLQRSKIERRITTSVFLILSFIVLFLLLTATALNNFITDNKVYYISSFSEVEFELAVVEELKKESELLKSDLAMYLELKNRSPQMSTVLKVFPEALNDKTVLTAVKIVVENDSRITFEVTGVVSAHSDVAELISNIDNLEYFNNVSLMYISNIDRKRFDPQSILPNKKLYQFNISGIYNDI